MAKRAEYLGPEKRRPLVLDAALGVFAEGGFADASMSAIAEAAGVSKAVLYDCFPKGKQEIFYTLCDRIDRTFMDHMLVKLKEVDALSLDEAMRQGYKAMVQYAHEHPDEWKIVFGEPGTADAKIAERARQSKELIITKMGERSRATVAATGVDPSKVHQVFERSLVAVGIELGHWLIDDPDLPTDEVIDLLVLWFMKGFERIIPEDAWKSPPTATAQS